MGKYRNLLLLALLLVFLVFMFLLSSGLLSRVLVSLTQAAPAGRISFTESLVLGNRLVVAADGKEEVEVVVFLRDGEGKAIRGRRVSMTGLDSLLGVEKTSDENGKAIFNASSSAVGRFELTALVEGTSLPMKVVVTFR